jgi:hypothetical protein
MLVYSCADTAGAISTAVIGTTGVSSSSTVVHTGSVSHPMITACMRAHIADCSFNY